MLHLQNDVGPIDLLLGFQYQCFLYTYLMHWDRPVLLYPP